MFCVLLGQDHWSSGCMADKNAVFFQCELRDGPFDFLRGVFLLRPFLFFLLPESQAFFQQVKARISFFGQSESRLGF